MVNIKDRKLKKYILFGAGKTGLDAIKLLGRDAVFCFCDNCKSGQVIEGKPVIDIAYLQNIYLDHIVVVSTIIKHYEFEIAMQLRERKIPFVLYEELLDQQAKDWYKADSELYEAKNTHRTFAFNEDYAYPITNDKDKPAGGVASYFWQDLWAAQHIEQHRVSMHYDIGSRVDGFIAHLLSYRQKVCLLDIRPLPIEIPGVDFKQCDATNLDEVEDNSLESLSALCSLEHFGLGRYGDPIDPDACFKCFAAIQRKMKQGGRVYISLPIGKEHLEYNAHRVFYAQTVVEQFAKMRLLEFSVTFNSPIEYNVDLHKYDDCMEWGGERFGLFMFEKR